MSDDRKDPNATVPERRRVADGAPRQSTIVVPLPAGAGHSTIVATPIDSYQPAPPHSTAHPGSIAPPTLRELIVPSTTSVSSILEQLRRPLSQRLEVESKIGAGGMGQIEIAVDRALDRRLAIKTLHPHLRHDESSVRMFLREARLTGILDHPHIVPVYDLGERDVDRLYFAMKLVEGTTLAAMIQALPRGPLDTATLFGLLDIVTKVCDALAFAHSRGVLHCDIKPANVMVGEFGEVYLMDWGIARLISMEATPASAPNPEAPRRVTSHPVGYHAARQSATDNSVIGTPCYMSPEQARGDRAKLDARSDVFLLGAMLYEILTRRPPYSNADRGETLALAMAGTFPSPRKVAGEVAVPLELERIILRALARDPKDRHPSVVAFKEDLSRFMRGGAEFPRRTFSAGDVIVREGEAGDAAFIIVEGHCEVRKDLPGGTQTLRTIGPGEVFGEMAIMTEGPRTATVVALEETTVLVVTSAVLEQEMAALKPWIATLLKSLATRFREIDTRHRATYSASPSPVRLANQVLMHMNTWGEDVPGGGKRMAWGALAAELEAQLGLPPIALFGAITRYGMVLDVEGDTLTVSDPRALAARLKKDLG